MTLESLEKTPGSHQAPFDEGLAQAKELAVSLLDNIRRLTSSLRPAELDVLGLESAIRACLESRFGGSEVTFRLDTSGPDKRFPPILESQIFRIAQELVHNVAKHASARNVRVTLDATADKVRLTVEDDGKGFNLNEASKNAARQKHFGLVGVQERAEILGGDVKMESEPGKGTRVTVTVPLQVPRLEPEHSEQQQHIAGKGRANNG